MAINPNIALQVQPPAPIAPPPSPLDSLAKVLQIKNAMAQQPLIDASVQRAGLENQQLGQQIGATNALNDAYKSAVTVGADGTPSIDKSAITNTLATKGFGSQIPTVMEHLTKYETDLTDLQKKKNEIELGERNAVGSAALAAKSANYDPEVFANTLDLAAAHGYKEAAQIKQAILADPTKAKLFIDQAIANSPDAAKLLNEQTATATGAKQATTAATRLELETPELQAKGALAQAKANLAKDPSSFVAQVDSLKLPDATAQRLKSQLSFLVSRGQVDEALKVLDQGAQDANAPGKAAAVEAATAPIRTQAEIDKETNPRVLAARTQQAVTTAKALREGDNPALAGVPPAAVASATSAATKLDLDYAKAKASADSIETVLKLAGAGNKAAGANASLVGVGAVNAVNGIKRINSAEIAQYGTAGSLLDKIQGKLQDWTEGQPIPKDVLNDMRALHTALRQSSYQQYTDGLNSINQRYGAKFGPTAPNPIAADPAMKAYADKYFGGDVQKALQYNQSQGH